MEHDRIIGKTDKPMDWVNSLVIVEKKDGSLRLRLDPKDLNSVIRHGNFQVPSFEDVVHAWREEIFRSPGPKELLLATTLEWRKLLLTHL